MSSRPRESGAFQRGVEDFQHTFTHPQVTMDRESKDGIRPSRRDFLMEMTALAMLGNKEVTARILPGSIANRAPASHADDKEKFVAICL